MKKSDFLITVSLEEVVYNHKTATDADSVKWHKIHWLCFKKGKPFTIKFKHTLNELADFHELDLKQRRARKKGKNCKASNSLQII